MLKALEDISTTKKRITIEVPAETIEREITESLEYLKRTTDIPGFRVGKAPMSLIEKRFGKKVEDEVLGRIIPRAYMAALREANLKPVTDPVVEEQVEFKRHHPFLMTLLIEVMPRIDLNYEGIKVKDIPVTVTEEDVENVLKGLQEDRATFEPSDGPVDMNDLILCDYYIRSEGIEKKDQIYKIGGPLFPEDVVKNLIGKGKGISLTLETTFPDSYPDRVLAGKKAELFLTIKDVKKGNLPKLDDEFARDLGFNTLEELRSHLHDQVLRLKKAEVAKIQKAEIINKLLESHEFDLPETLLEEEIDSIVISIGEKRGVMTDEEGLKRLREEVRPEAIRNLKTIMLLSQIGKKEGVIVSDEEIKDKIKAMAMQFSVSPENIMKSFISRDGSLDKLRDFIFEEKVLDLLLNKAIVEKGEEN